MAETHQLLTNEFLSTYDAFPKHMTPMGLFVYLRTYSRFLMQEKRRETYKETCIRATLYNLQLVINHLSKIGYQIDWEFIKKEAELLFSNMYNMKQFVSGRTLWIGGTQAASRCSLANFNCAAINITKWEDLCDLFYLLMVGTGVGFKSTKQSASDMTKIRSNTTLIHSQYVPLSKRDRLEHTKLVTLPNGFAKIYVGDSKEGWVQSLRSYLEILTNQEYEYIHTIKISYNSVRPRGERLRTFGGTSSGPEPLKEMFDGIDKTLKSKLDSWVTPLNVDEKGYVRVRPIHIMDIGNLIGQNVVVGYIWPKML
jgi:ribonucleoside-diphosphate reductase alpha chain/ribonucleoside-triphosphate reductase